MDPSEPTTHRFEFTVGKDGNFLYGKREWSYRHGETRELLSSAGPFTIEFEPEDVPAIYGFDPFHGPLTAKERTVDGKREWVASTTIDDGLTDAQREAIRKANRPETGKPAE